MMKIWRVVNTIIRIPRLPEPNGYLRTRNLSLPTGFGIAQDYRGQCSLRFDDATR